MKKSFFPGSDDLTPYALKIVTEQWNKRVSYASMCATSKKFYVRHKTSHLTTYDSPIPKFIHIRQVTIDEGFTHCSCGFYCRYRLPCHHLLHVLDAMKISYCGIWWTNLYSQYYGTENTIALKLKQMQTQETDKVKISDELSDITMAECPFIYRSKTVRDPKFFTEFLEKL